MATPERHAIPATPPETVATSFQTEAPGNATQATIPVSDVRTPHRSGSFRDLQSSVVSDEGRFVPGTLIAGRYRVISMLGRGGMGEVYRATDLTLAQSVALKFLPEDAARSQLVLERFHNEVRVARQVSHPNVCRVYDIGEAEGMPFISMEYVDGEDLAALLLRIGRLPSQKALEITRKLCAGLSAAHERGIIHRDLKPHNIMLNKRGEVVIMDFGLAAIAQQIEGLEARNGTPAYMAPEQLRGDSVTAKSDIYSLGLIAYELFTGQRAFEGKSAAEQLSLQEAARPTALSSVARDVDPAVENAIALCLQPDPALRPSNALLVAAALPGGDPLAAALAAGQTPSPELVAASGKTEGFPLSLSVPCLLFVVLSLVLIPVVSRPGNVLALTPAEFSGPVLQQKARDISTALGYPTKPSDRWGMFRYAPDLAGYLAKHRNGKSWSDLFAAASPLEYVYRQSPQLLVADPEGEISEKVPPFDLPGMIRVVLDSKGQIREFAALPNAKGSQPANAVDPPIIFTQLGLDFGKFREVSPTVLPQVAFDSRRAWQGPYSSVTDFDVTVDVASYHGFPVSVRIRWPWTNDNAGAPAPATLRQTLFAIENAILFLGGIFCACFFARHNLLAGRGDRAGAFRVAAAALLFLLVSLFRVHVVPTLHTFAFLWEDFGQAFLLSGLLWLMYIALEPAIRARWPHSLITWNRLLAGQLSDPRLGSHILLACAAASLGAWMFVGRLLWFLHNGSSPDGPDPRPLNGLTWYVSYLGSRLFSALLWGTAVFFVLSGLRRLVRKDWIASLIAGCVMLLVEDTVRNSAALGVDIAIYLAFYCLTSLILLRVGLLPGLLMIFVLNVAFNSCFGQEWSSWFNWIGITGLLIPLGLALYGFWRSQGGRPQAAARPFAVQRAA